MNRGELLAALAEIGMRPGRGLGQNFLCDANLLDAIVREAAPQSGETVLEVGPGFGALTRKLLAAGAQVIAVEFDHRIADYLRKHLQAENLTLVEADACRVDLASLLPREGPFRSIANLPYSISSIFLMRLLELPRLPEGMVFMLQREMADRLCAVPGSKDYGALSVRIQFDYRVKIVRAVPPEVFYPPPEVDSAVVSFTRLPREADARFRRHLAGVVRTAFAQRRKQMGRVLAANFGREKVEAALAAAGIPWEIRPDRVPVETFVALTEKLYP